MSIRAETASAPASAHYGDSASDAHHAFAYGITLSSDLSAFADVWPTLESTGDVSAYVFQRREWLEIWMATIGAHRRIKPLFVRVDAPSGAPLMLLPLGVEKRYGLRILTFLDGFVSDYNAPVLFPGASELGKNAVDALWRSLCDVLPTFDAAMLIKMPHTVDGVPNPLRLLSGEPNEHSGHCVELISESGVGYVPKAGHFRRDSNRRRRRLNEIAPVRFAIAQTPDENDRLLKVMMRQKRRRYLETYGKDLFDDAGFRAYFETMTARLAPEGRVQLSALYCGDEPVAANWGLVTADRFYYLMPSYESGRWAGLSPGRLLLEDLIAWALARNLRVFDLGIGDEEYKSKCASLELPLQNAFLPTTLAGTALFGAIRARRALARSFVGDAVRFLRAKRIAARLERNGQ